MPPTRQQRRATERATKKTQLSLSKMKMFGRLRFEKKDASGDQDIEKSGAQQILSIFKFIIRVLGWQYYVWQRRPEVDPLLNKKTQGDKDAD